MNGDWYACFMGVVFALLSVLLLALLLPGCAIVTAGVAPGLGAALIEPIVEGTVKGITEENKHP